MEARLKNKKRSGKSQPKRATAQRSAFASRRVGEIEAIPNVNRWLVESLWAGSGVGIVGGTPKSGKTWFSLELALSVAGGRPAFEKFEATQGPVVLYPAEDSPGATRRRVDLLAKGRGIDVATLPLFIIEADRVHLDEKADRRKLEALLQKRRPKLLILDPLVRLHKGSESTAQHMAELLGYLRGIQRRFDVAVMLTHHLAKQRGRPGVQHGQTLRGSGDLHAWGDSNLYLTKLHGGVVALNVEHRNAPSLEAPLYVKLRVEESSARLELTDPPSPGEEVGEGGATTLHVLKPGPRKAPPLREALLSLLEREQAPLSQVTLRKALHVRNQALTDVLREVQEEGLIIRDGRGWKRSHDATVLTSSPVAARRG